MTDHVCKAWRSRLKSIPTHGLRYGVKSQSMKKKNKENEFLASVTNTEFFILTATEEFQWLVLIWSTSFWHTPLVLNTNFSLLLFPGRSQKKRMAQGLKTNAPRKKNNTEKSLPRTSTIPTFWVKIIWESQNHIWGLERNHHVSTSIFQITVC